MWTGIVYALVIFALLGTAVYEHVTTSSLSLPLSPTLTILAILLPILSLLSAVFLPAFLSAQPQFSQRFRQILSGGIHLVQLLLTTVLATLFLSTAMPSASRSCLLSTAWQTLFRGKNAAAIRHIQDAFDCCGFNSVRDRAWPFAEDLGTSPPCAERFGRSMSCVGAWTAALQRTAGVDGGVVVAVGVLQILTVLFRRWLSSRRRGGADGNWPSFFKPLAGPGEAGPAATRPLLAGEAHTDDGNEAEHTAADEENGGPVQDRHREGYGGTGHGPRVEPAPFGEHEERNAWEE